MCCHVVALRPRVLSGPVQHGDEPIEQRPIAAVGPAPVAEEEVVEEDVQVKLLVLCHTDNWICHAMQVYAWPLPCMHELYPAMPICCSIDDIYGR